MNTKGLSQIPTRDMSREEWLERRRGSIGGSDAAGIVGLSHWSTPFTVWADKTGRMPDKPDTEAMRLGRDLEDYVARRWMEETGKKVRRLQAMLYNPAYPFAHADVDREVVGEHAGLECKTTSTLDLKQFKGVEFPEKYYVQCVHYMAVTGADRWYLAVLVLGRGLFTYTLERDQAEIDALMDAEGDFWSLVESDTMPEPDGAEATAEALETIYAEDNGGDVVLFGREGLLREYMALKEQDKQLKTRMEEITNTIKADMGEAAYGAAGRYNVVWKAQQRRTLDVKSLQKNHPELDLAPYYKTTAARPFKVVEAKEQEE